MQHYVWIKLIKCSSAVFVFGLSIHWILRLVQRKLDGTKNKGTASSYSPQAEMNTMDIKEAVESAGQGPADIVAAIDLGATYSGYAFSTKATTDDIILNEEWQKEKGRPTLKTPSVYITQRNSPDTLEAYGYEAMNFYTRSETGKYSFYPLYEHFKRRKGDQSITDEDSKVLTTTLEYFREHLLGYVTRKLKSKEIGDLKFKWVLPVPDDYTADDKKYISKIANEVLIDTKTIKPQTNTHAFGTKTDVLSSKLTPNRVDTKPSLKMEDIAKVHDKPDSSPILLSDPNDDGSKIKTNNSSDPNDNGSNIKTENSSDRNDDGLKAKTNDPSDPNDDGSKATTNNQSHPNDDGSKAKTNNPSDPNDNGSKSKTNNPSDPNDYGSKAKTNNQSNPNDDGSKSNTNNPSNPNDDCSKAKTNNQSNPNDDGSKANTNNPSNPNDDRSKAKTNNPSDPNDNGSKSKTNNPSNPNDYGSKAKTNTPSDPNDDGSKAKTNNQSNPNDDGSKAKTSNSSHPKNDGSKANTNNPSHPNDDGSEAKTNNPSDLKDDGSEAKTNNPSDLKDDGPKADTNNPSHPNDECSKAKINNSSDPNDICSKGETNNPPDPNDDGSKVKTNNPYDLNDDNSKSCDGKLGPVLFLSEIQAAAIWCQNYPLEVTADKEIPMANGTSYIVVNAGGSHIDIAVCQKVDSTKVLKLDSNVIPLSLDDEFEKILEQAFGKTKIRKYQSKYHKDWIYITTEFENIKRTYDLHDPKDARLDVPITFYNHVNTNSVLTYLPIISQYFKNKLEFEDGHLIIPTDKLKTIFNPMHDVISRIENVLETQSEYLFVVGGFSKTIGRYIRKDESTTLIPIMPLEGDVSVLKGCVLYGQSLNH